MGEHVIGILEYTVILAVAAGTLNFGLKSRHAFLKPVLVVLGGGAALVGGLGVLVNLGILLGVL